MSQEQKTLKELQRQLEIEAALERVRDRSMTMHSTDELQEVLNTVYTQFLDLNVDISGGAFLVINEDIDSEIVCWGAGGSADYVQQVHLPYMDMPIYTELMDGIKKRTAFFRESFSYEEKQDFLKELFKNPPYNKSSAARKKEVLSRPGGYTRSCVVSENTSIFIINHHGRDFTAEENEILRRIGKVFEQTYVRFLDLQKAEAQAREAQVEAALERVRSSSMAMHKSEELKEVIRVIFDQLALLHINAEHAGIVVDYEPKKDFHFWVADNQDIPARITVPYLDLVWDRQFTEAKKKGEDFFTTQLGFEEKNSFYKKLLPHIEGLTKQAADFYFSCPGLAASTAIQKDIGLYIENFSGTPYSAEENNLLMRFGKVFQQTYTRFLDLKTAEAQAREAQIEASLERVRARSMAMQTSEELSDVLSVLFQQFDLLGIDPKTAWLTLWNPEDHTFTYRSTGISGLRIQGQQVLDIGGMDIWKELYEKWKTDTSDSVEVLFYPKEDLKQLFGLLEETFSAMPKKERLTPEHFPNGGYSVQGHCKFGYLGYNHTREPSEEEKEILTRFATEFGRVYQRFLDLQDAEHRAREAQIEAALERVRARTMAMHKSEELGEVAAVLFEQINNLGATLERLNIGIVREDEEIIAWWSTEQGGRQIDRLFKGSIHEPTTISKVYTAWKEGIKSLEIDQTGQELKQWIRYVTEEIGLPFDPKLMQERRVHAAAFFKHGTLLVSTPEPLPEGSINLLERFAAVFEQTYTRFLDLQKAEKQARESEIEAALERVRSKTMAMHNSQDVSDTVITLFQEVMKLGLDESIRCGIGILEGNEGMETWSANADQKGEVNLKMGMLNMTIHPMLKGLKKAWEKGEKGYSYHFEGADVTRYYTALNNEPEYPLHMDLSKLPDNQFAKTFLFTEGILFAFTKTPLSEEAIRVLGRFADVFGQTYRRYLDLLKAEDQAREAQIEASLERVRASTMAMHNTEDIADTVATFFDELLGLGLGNSTRCGIGILSPSEVMKVWTASIKNKNEIALHSGSLQMHGHPVLKGVQKAWSEEKSLFEYTLAGEDKLRYFKVINQAPDYPVKISLDNLTNSIYHYSFVFPQGVLFVFSESPLTEEIRDIFTRFASVFGQTYTRFLDLESAEARARESEIEAALERVRAKAMAMHGSEDLRQTISAIFEELKHLNVRSLRMGLGLINPDKPEGEIVASYIDDNDQIIEVSGKMKFEGHPVLERIYDHFKKGLDYIDFLQGDEITSYYAALNQSIDVKGYGTDTRHYGCFLPFQEGGIYAWAAEPHTDEQIDILKKFSRVVEITYRRYKDLVEAEAREKEAVKQASLDRVRAEIASMRTTEDLERITPLVWKELTTLGIPFFRCGVFIMDEANQMVHVYLTTPEGDALAAMDLPFDFEVSLIQQGVEYWKKQKPFIDHWEQEQFVELTQKLMEFGQVENIQTYQAGEKPPERLELHLVPFAQGMLYVGSSQTLSDMEMDIVKALTSTFAVAYARYEDFNQLEKTLGELKATQKQLIHSEKMASLGELTAGIAHEIKNPLNFVNNFSDVSKELLEELLEELKNGEMEEVEALAKDIIQNLEKIVHHGHRADSIVKGMLQHSRSGDGNKEPTDLNALADEYLRLAYHGLRAKDKSFNAVINTDFDPTMGSVDLIPQDMGRVILNLLTNAFYAVNEKSSAGKASENGSYEPTVTVKTKRLNDLMEISVSDNGGGISKKVLDKIFQPFFTTKPTGQGTGLGLSLSYDIVKAHGGELSAETEEGKGTTFFIKFKSKS